MTPAYYAIVRLGSMLPGSAHVVLRVPSILGYILSLLGVYWFVRKRLPPFAGVVAVLLITVSPFRWYATEARCYALLTGFVAISAVFWQRIDERRFMTPLFAVFLALAASCHPLAVVIISAFGAAELILSVLSRRIRWGVWAACLFAAAPFFMELPMLLRFRVLLGAHYWSLPSWSTLIVTYEHYLGFGYDITFLIVALIGMSVGAALLRSLRESKKGAQHSDFGPSELVLIAGLLFYPALLVVLTKLLHSGYVPRYGWPGALGLAIGSVCSFRTFWRWSSSVHILVGALLLAFGAQACHDFDVLSKTVSAKDERWTNLTALIRDLPDVPVVIANGVTYLEAVQYAPSELRKRLLTVVDFDTAFRLIGSDSLDRENRILARFFPLRVEDRAPFLAAHRKFILRSGVILDWFVRYLLEQKYHLRLVSGDADGFDFIVEK
jgi:hypothetical protein